MNEVLDERDDTFVQHKFGVGANARAALAYTSTYALGSAALLWLSTHPVVIGHVVFIEDDAILIHELVLASMFFAGLLILAIDDQGGILPAAETLVVAEATCCVGTLIGVCPQIAYACIATGALFALVGIAKISECAPGKQAGAIESFFMPAWWVVFCLSCAVNISFAACELLYKLQLC